MIAGGAMAELSPGSGEGGVFFVLMMSSQFSHTSVKILARHTLAKSSYP